MLKQSHQTKRLICQFDRPVFKAVKIDKIVDSGCCMIHHSIRYVDCYRISHKLQDVGLSLFSERAMGHFISENNQF